MRLLAWNINHRTRPKAIPPSLTRVLAALAPDVVVLTEYVSAPSRATFLEELAFIGLGYVCVSPAVPKQNHVLIASRSALIPGSIQARAIDPSLPSNVLHVRLPGHGLEILGLRIPDYSKQPVIRRQCWDWITETARAVKDRPFVILGDFNTDPDYSPARCGDRIGSLVGDGWQHAAPAEGASYWTPRAHPVRIDHAFVSKHFNVRSARYVRDLDGYVLAGRGRGALSDHAALLLDIDPAREASV